MIRRSVVVLLALLFPLLSLGTAQAHHSGGPYVTVASNVPYSAQVAYYNHSTGWTQTTWVKPGTRSPGAVSRIVALSSKRITMTNSTGYRYVSSCGGGLGVGASVTVISIVPC